LESNLRSSVKNGLISEKELKKALAGMKKDFPKGIEAIGADALRLGLCSYDVQSMDDLS